MGIERAHSSQTTPAASEPSLLLSIVRRRKRVVLITTAVTVFATLALTLQQTKIYAGTADVVVQAPPSKSPTAGPNMATEAQIAQSLAVARLVHSRLRPGIPPAELLGQLAVRVPADSEVLKFTYSSPLPSQAQKGAQAFAEAYVTVRRRQFENQILASATSTAERIHAMSAKLSTLRRQIAGTTGERGAALRIQRDALTSEIALLQQELADLNGAAASFSPATLLGPASLPRSPARPNLPVNVFLALVGGLLLGFGIAAIAEYADRRVRGATDLEARLGVPVLGQIPDLSDGAEGALPTLVAIDAPASEGATAFRRLRTNLAAAAAETGTRSVAITSIDADDVPIELAANLAAVLATSGKRVILLSPRRGEATLEALLGARPGRGFLDALAGTVPIEKAVSTTGIENLLLCGRSAPSARARQTENAPSPVAAVASVSGVQSLGTDRVARLIEDVAATADIVLVDAPPLLADPDGAVIAGACDGVLAVARSTTRREDVERAREQFDRVRARLLGGVLLDRSQRRRPSLADSVGSLATTHETDNRQPDEMGDQRPRSARRQRTLGATGGETP